MKRCLLATTLLLLVSCASNSLFLDAVPIGDRNQKLIIGGSLRGAYDSTRHFGNTDISFVPVDVVYIKGFTDRTDFFLDYTVPLVLHFGVKYTLNETSENSLCYSAIGPSLGIDLLSLFNKDSTNKDSPIYFDLRLPFYQTFALCRYFAISLIPDFLMRVDYRFFQILSGGNINTRIGKDFGTVIEGSYHYNFRYKQPEIQIGASFFFSLKEKIRSE